MSREPTGDRASLEFLSAAAAAKLVTGDLSTT